MATATNVSPYFDDYSEDKNFHKILFKPGVAVQSRELTQTQTILQNQIKRIGDYLFTDGQKITGTKPSVNLNARTIRLKEKDIYGKSIVLSDYLGKYVSSAASDIIGEVEFIFEKDNPTVGDAPSVVISLKKFNTTNNGIYAAGDQLLFYSNLTDALNKTNSIYTAVVDDDIIKNAISTCSPYSKIITFKNPTSFIEVGDLLIHSNLTKNLYVTEVTSSLQITINEAPGITIDEENIQYTKTGTCPTTIVTQDTTYFYKNGYMLRSGIEKIVPDKNTAYPTKFIGLLVSEQIVTSGDDTTLLDPAVGSSNYFAPGADRLQINLSLTSFELNSDNKPNTTENIIPLLSFNKGEIEYVVERDASSGLREEIENRTYDESGNYIVDKFLVTPSLSLLSESIMRINVSGGKAYVGGREVSTISTTEMLVPKPTATDTKYSYNITTTQGNYIQIIDLNGQGGSNMIIPRAESIVQGEMYLELHNTTNPTSSATKVGTLAFKNIEYDSSLGETTQFKLFFHYLDQVTNAPATWEAWSARYNISVADGQFIANTFYSSPTSSTLLGNYGPASTPCYALFREPDVAGVAYWYDQWNRVDGRDIAKTKQKFALSLLSDNTNTDYARMISSTKSFLAVTNGSPFIDGIIDVKQARSVVGVSNSLTSHLTAATYASPFFYANVSPSSLDRTGSLLVLDSRPSDSLIFPIAKSYIKTVNNLKTTYTKVIRGAVFTGGIYTLSLSAPEFFPLGDGTVVASTARTNFVVAVKAVTAGSISKGVFNFVTGSVTISSDSTVAQINLGDVVFSGVADIHYQIETDALPPRAKTLVKDASQYINITTADLAYSLKISDIAAFTGIYDKIGSAYGTIFRGAWGTSNSYTYNDIVINNGVLYKAISPSSNVATYNTNTWSIVNGLNLSTFALSDGQKDGWYDHGSVRYIGATSGIPGNVLVTYDYFTHSGEGPCTADSYPLSYYKAIKDYTSTSTGRRYSLRDSLDFRPKRINGSNYLNFDPAVFPVSTVNTEADVTYFLGRIDKLYISKDSRNFDSPYNKFYIKSGVEQNVVNVDTVQKSEDKNSLAIATLFIPPTAVSAFEITIVLENASRFTMKDIGEIQKATVRLDKQVKIHSVEIANLKASIVNDKGDILLKSGVFIENFIDFSRADLLAGSFQCAINTSQGVCSPMYSAYEIALDVTSATNINISKDIITAAYTEEILASNLEANSLTNPNPGGINDGRGRSTISKQNSRKLNLLQTGLMIAAGYLAYVGVSAAVVAGAAAIAGGAGVGGVILKAGSAAIDAVGSTIVSAYKSVSDLSSLTQAYDFVLAKGVEYYEIVKSGVKLAYDTIVGTTTTVTGASAYTGSATATVSGSSPTWMSQAAPYVPYIVAAVVVYEFVLSDADRKNVDEAVNWVGDNVNGAIGSISNAAAEVNDWVESW